MNLLTLIVGAPSSGKTTSFRNLGPETVLYNTERKMLPFKNKGIKLVTTETVNDLLAKLAQFKGDKFPEIKNIVIDSFSDFSDLLIAECRARYKGFDVYSSYAGKIYELFQALKGIENKYIFVTGHPEILQDAEGNTIFRMGCRGKEYSGTIERFATCVFYSDPKRKPSGKGVVYQFLTNSDGSYPAKTPSGMYDAMHIDNDVSKITETYTKFYLSEISLSGAAFTA